MAQDKDMDTREIFRYVCAKCHDVFESVGESAKKCPCCGSAIFEGKSIKGN